MYKNLLHICLPWGIYRLFGMGRQSTEEKITWRKELQASGELLPLCFGVDFFRKEWSKGQEKDDEIKRKEVCETMLERRPSDTWHSGAVIPGFCLPSQGIKAGDGAGLNGFHWGWGEAGTVCAGSRAGLIISSCFLPRLIMLPSLLGPFHTAMDGSSSWVLLSAGKAVTLLPCVCCPAQFVCSAHGQNWLCWRRW